jgi:hypothetical protein
MSLRAYFTTPATEPTETKAAVPLSAQDYDSIAYLYNYTKRLQVQWERQKEIWRRPSLPSIPSFPGLLTDEEWAATPRNGLPEKWVDNEDFGLFVGEKPELILNAVKAFNECYEQHRASSELMDRLNAFINTVNAVIEFKGYRRQGKSINKINEVYPLRKAKEQYVALFERICPELEIFVQRHAEEMQSQDESSPHSVTTLNWKTLKLMQPILLRLKQQIEHRRYSLHTWMSTEEDMAAECSTEIIKQIELFSQWFVDQNIKIHNFSNAHIACRRASKDLVYLVKMIEASPVLPRLIKDLGELQPFLTMFYKKCGNTLGRLRIKEKESYIENLELLQAVKKLRTEVADAQPIDTTKAVITAAVKAGLDKESESKKALDIIKSKLKYMDKKEHSAIEQTTFARIIDIIAEAKRVSVPAKPAAISDAKLALPNPSPQLKPDYRPIESLLSWGSLDKFRDLLEGKQQESKALLITLREKNYTNLFGSVTAKERERLALIEYLQSFNAFFAEQARGGRGAAALKEANEALVDLLDRIRLSTELEQDSEINSLTKPIVYLFNSEVGASIRSVRLDLAVIQSDNKKMLVETQQLKAAASRLAGETGESMLAFYIKQACREQSAQPKPYENALSQIVILIYLIILNTEAPKPSMASLNMFYSIFNTVNEAITLPEKPAHPAYLPS